MPDQISPLTIARTRALEAVVSAVYPVRADDAGARIDYLGPTLHSEGNVRLTDLEPVRIESSDHGADLREQHLVAADLVSEHRIRIEDMLDAAETGKLRISR